MQFEMMAMPIPNDRQIWRATLEETKTRKPCLQRCDKLMYDANVRPQQESPASGQQSRNQRGFCEALGNDRTGCVPVHGRLRA